MGAVGLSDCTFVQWGKESDRAAIQASSGSILIRGCEFMENGKIKNLKVTPKSWANLVVVVANSEQ